MVSPLYDAKFERDDLFVLTLHDLWKENYTYSSIYEILNKKLFYCSFGRYKDLSWYCYKNKCDYLWKISYGKIMSKTL